MSSALDITRSVRPPRAAFLDYPLGHTTGKPHEPETQRDILVAALDAFATLSSPGELRVLPFRWSDSEDWKRTAMTGDDDRRERFDTPQYQNEEDARRAEQVDPAACSICGVAV